MPYHLIADTSPPASPLVFDSPHSWGDWPAGTPCIAPDDVVRTSWDAFIDELWAGAAQGRAPVLAARFHRAFIDANRGRDDIDPQLLDGPWPQPLNPTKKSLRGQGLIRRDAVPGVPLYEGPLAVGEVQRRIDQYYHPYHARLAQLLDAAYARFGFVCHIDCHSMKSVGNAMNDDEGRERPDIVVSDLEGRSSCPAFTGYVAQHLTALGYRVQVNDPYKGAELVRRFSDPARGRYSVQIEIKRGIYMDERRFVKNEGFARLAADMQAFVNQMLRDFEGELGAQLRPRVAQ